MAMIDQARRELIVYATPIGPLADAIDHYGRRVEADLGSTVAQTYPPHCTLTGFFHRDDGGAATAIDEVGHLVAEAGPVPDDAVEVVNLTVTDRWVGLELRSPWLLGLAASMAAEHRVDRGDDAIRLKEWLHLSLAYGAPDGQPIDLTAHGRLARASIDPTAEVAWQVAMWERHRDGSWSRHLATPG